MYCIYIIHSCAGSQLFLYQCILLFTGSNTDMNATSTSNRTLFVLNRLLSALSLHSEVIDLFVIEPLSAYSSI